MGQKAHAVSTASPISFSSPALSSARKWSVEWFSERSQRCMYWSTRDANRTRSRGRGTQMKSPKWPVWLFVGTILAGLVSAGVTYLYYDFTTEIQEQKDQADRQRAAYEEKIESLKRRLVVPQVVTERIQAPVTTTKCSSVFGRRVCVPQVRIESREIKRVVSVPDPAAQRELDEAYRSIQALSQSATKTEEKLVKVEDIRDVIKTIMAPLISLLVIAASLYVILSAKYKADSEKWAFGSIGTIIGFWLKGT